MQTYLETTANPTRHAPAGRLLIVSNRGPVEHSVEEDSGELQRGRARGGLATALGWVAQKRPVTWIASAMSRGDRKAASENGAIDLGDDKRLRLVAVPRQTFDLFYRSLSNRVLWFLQHSMWDRLQQIDPQEVTDAWERGYVPVNEAFSEVVMAELRRNGGSRHVMIHDYHFYALPLFIRNREPEAVLQHFMHIPWPEAQAWTVLPSPIVESICGGLLANDSIVFQTQQSVENFIVTCQVFLSDAQVDLEAGVVVRNGRRTRVWANPISVDVDDLLARVRTDRAREYQEKFASEVAERTIVRVDRLDPSKNVVAGFQAFDLLLERHPEWAGRVKLFAFLVPSRRGIPEYKAYADEVFSLVDAINRRHGRPDWTPIALFHEHNRPQALAAMTLYDVLLVNPVRDGMNLVSKEGPVVNQRDGVLVLSRTAGSYAELKDGALPVEPADIEGTAETLHKALLLPQAERRERAQKLRRAVQRHDVDRWLQTLLEDFDTIERERLSSAG